MRKWLDIVNENFSLPDRYGSDAVMQIAQKHKVPVKDIEKQLEMGIRVEHEHTNDTDAAREIALDHLEEFPDYYDRLKQAES